MKSVGFSSFDFSCTADSKMFNINQKKAGDVAASFINFTIEESKPILETTIKESASYVPLREGLEEAILNYTKDIKCAQ